MNVDLETSLDQLARSVHDDAVAERMTGQVHQMVAQIRRRRAARYTATGLVSLGTVAVVAVAGVQLAGRNATPEPVATQPDAPAVAWPGCGDAAPEAPEPPDKALILEGQAGPTAPYGEPVPLRLTLINFLSSTVDTTSAIDLVVLRDGVVVGTAETDPLALGLVPGGPVGPPAAGHDRDGGDTPLDQGEYQMVATFTLELSIGTTRTVVTDPMPFTITEAPGPAAELRQEMVDRDREAALSALIAEAAARTEAFPACGSIVPSGDDLPLGIDLALGEQSYTSGETVTTEVTVRTTQGRAVIGNAPIAGALIVLTRDGVVVGRGYRAPGDVDVLDLAADQTATVPATGVFSLCTIPQTDAAQDGLPAGTYQAYAVMDVMLKQVTEAGGEAASVTKLVAVRSNPVDITVGVP